jgi:hypothetical protein
MLLQSLNAQDLHQARPPCCDSRMLTNTSTNHTSPLVSCYLSSQVAFQGLVSCPLRSLLSGVAYQASKVRRGPDGSMSSYLPPALASSISLQVPTRGHTTQLLSHSARVSTDNKPVLSLGTAGVGTACLFAPPPPIRQMCCCLRDDKGPYLPPFSVLSFLPSFSRQLRLCSPASRRPFADV